MNLGRTQQRIRWLTVAVLVGSGLLLTILDSTGALVGVFGFLRDPLTGITAWTSARTEAVSDVVSGPRNLAAAREEIAALEAQVAEQERELEELREIQNEAQLLRELFGEAAQTPEYRRVIADVIGQDTNPTMQSIIINKGVDDGVRTGMPVEAARGLGHRDIWWLSAAPDRRPGRVGVAGSACRNSCRRRRGCSAPWRHR